MFSQLRHAVETLAQHSPKPSLDGAFLEEPQPRPSLDAAALRQSLASASHPTDSVTALRRTLVNQRPTTPSVRTTTERSPTPRLRVTLEDRLRAKFAVGEASTGTSPGTSSISSAPSTPTSVVDHPFSPSTYSAASKIERRESLSPKSIPLPDSPELASAPLSPLPLSAFMDHPLATDSVEASNDAITNHLLSKEGTMPSEKELPEVGGPKVNEEKPLPSSPETEDSKTEASPLSPHDIATAHAGTKKMSSSASTKSDASSMVAIKEPDAGGLDDVSIEGRFSEDVASTDHIAKIEDVSATQEDRDVALEVRKNLVDDSVGLAEPVGISTPLSDSGGTPDTEGLQRRLKLVEQRFSDVSKSFKRLQAEKAAADRTLKELTPLESIKEADALRDYLQNMTFKTEMTQDEIKRLTGKLTRQEERIEELRDIHRLESKSQLDQIHQLRAQVEEAEALLKANQGSSGKLGEEALKLKGEVEKLRCELEKAKSSAKDEEEKRIKAISLLKTVRQKLVKAEGERDNATKEVQDLKTKEKEEREKDRVERQKLQGEIEKAHTERETAIAGLKAHFDKELASLRERHEKELSALRGQYELEAVTTKATHKKEIENRDSRISNLENSVRKLSKDKDGLFDQLQMRQAELESSQTTLESIQSQTVELQYQLREATDRVTLLTEELTDARKEHASQTQGAGPSTQEVTRLLSAAEAKYEARIADLRRQLVAAERERDDGETEFSKKLSEKVKEIETLKGLIDQSSKNQEEEEGNSAALRKEIAALQDEVRLHQQVITELRVEASRVPEVESAAQVRVAEFNTRIESLQQQIEESKAREAQARANNKTLREELRKVQSSAALLERQRNPGVGYWAQRQDGTMEPRSPPPVASELPPNGSSRPESPSTSKSDEEVNFEYLRNVILQFLEHKEMRPHLVRILSTILRFTPQETRRLISKV